MQKKSLKKRTISFRQRVHNVVGRIPKGKFLTYKQVAKLAKHPTAYRAVGNILNENRNPKIPCHRVIKSNGEIGGYNKGVKKKVSLLRKEGVVIRNWRVVL